MCWAAGSLYSRGAPLPRRPLVSAGLASLCGGILLAGYSRRLGRDRRGGVDDGRRARPRLPRSSSGSFVGFTSYVWLLRVAPTSLVSTYAYVNPIVAVVLGWLILGEDVHGADGRRRRGRARLGGGDPARRELGARAGTRLFTAARAALRRPRRPSRRALSRRCTTSRPGGATTSRRCGSPSSDRRGASRRRE